MNQQPELVKTVVNADGSTCTVKVRELTEAERAGGLWREQRPEAFNTMIENILDSKK